jgi:hypothetical protein
MPLNKNKINEIKLWLWVCKFDEIMTALLQSLEPNQTLRSLN